MKKIIAAFVLLLGLGALGVAQQGGFPSKPRFLGVEISSATTSIAVPTGQLAINAATGAAPAVQFYSNGSIVGNIGVAQSAAQVCANSLANDVCISPGGGRFMVGGSLNLNGGAAATNLQPIISFDANLVTGPTVVQCHYCQTTPTVTKNSAGNFSLTLQAAGAFHWSCTVRNNASAPGFIAINSVTTGGVNLLAYNTAGTLTDPGTVECVGVS